ncbi:MAG: hypothetical protein CM1200mP34_4680 [Verrucomicrobiales bacterium]|nr:MAG: hypothetical protein CM1200mP34_4680 [Verrucomicrobiales bacterium]
MLPPDVNESQVCCPGGDGSVIRFGMAAIKGVGSIAVGGIIQARESGEPFSDLLTLFDRANAHGEPQGAEASSRAVRAMGFRTRAGQFSVIDRALAKAQARPGPRVWPDVALWCVRGESLAEGHRPGLPSGIAGRSSP